MVEIKIGMYEILKYKVGPIAGLDTYEKKKNTIGHRHYPGSQGEYHERLCMHD